MHVLLYSVRVFIEALRVGLFARGRHCLLRSQVALANSSLRWWMYLWLLLGAAAMSALSAGEVVAAGGDGHVH